ncbi:MAG TPA: zinc ribbon domain-containing protein [Gemmatimonadaceae bacterium]|jgi:putative FmdB family regulatory protein
MPIFEYTCKSCHHQFEALIRGSKTAVCPECKSEDLEKMFSLPAVKSESTHNLAMRAAKKRDHNTAVDRVEAQRYYEAHHDD